jgi:enoyl-CoA hydratase/carnithine racemase
MALVPELASSYYLAQLVGLGRAQEWCLTARMVEPAEALAAGLVTDVVPPGRLIDRACEIGEQIAQWAPSAVTRVRRAFQQNATDMDVASVMLRENFMNATARSEPDHREAVAAFMEKRPANFRR